MFAQFPWFFHYEVYQEGLKEPRLRILSSGEKIGIFFPIPQNLSSVDDQSTNEFLILPTPQISGFLADFDFSKLSRHCRDMSRQRRDKIRKSDISQHKRYPTDYQI